MSYSHMFTQESKACCSLMMQCNVLTQKQFWNLCFCLSYHLYWSLVMFQEMQIVRQCCCDLESDDAAVCYLRPQSLKGSEHVCLVIYQSWLVCSKYIRIPFFQISAPPLHRIQLLHFNYREGKRPGSKISQITWLLRNHSCNPHIYFSSLPAYDTVVVTGRQAYQSTLQRQGNYIIIIIIT